MTSFFGKYRGKVESNTDPLFLGRVQVSCPAVLGSGTMSWAMPCVPYAGRGVGVFMVPPVGANVWVEFEGGDPDHPIVAGCFWGTGEVPASPATPEMKMIKTDAVTLELTDLQGGAGLTISVNPPAVSPPVRIKLDANGVEITNSVATIRMQGMNVSVNDGALEVT